MFVDELELTVRGGRGGNGVVSFRREKYVARGGPDGGDGGNGGSIYLWSDPSKHSFLDLRYRRILKAADGGHGQSKNRHGASGADLLVPVPPGTLVRDEKGRVIADLTIPGQKALVAAGGRGGKGNARFTSSRRRAPRLAENGLPGEEKNLYLELKLMAQVGLVGLPNAGKSTLLSRITEAKPKIASYPFTTLSPNLGVVRVGDDGSFVVADLPGLIEGAHSGAGLGHQFLRHVERNLLLLFLVDLSPEAEINSIDAYHMLQNELEKYSPQLATYPKVIVGNKIDISGSENEFAMLSEAVMGSEGDDGLSLFSISAVTGEGINELTRYLFQRINKLEEEKEIEEPEALIYAEEAVETPLKIDKEDGVFVVSGSAVENMAAKTDFENEEAVKRFQNYCRKYGVEKELRKAGIKEGDTVRICSEEFYYYE